MMPRPSFVLLAFLLLSACGGSGSGGIGAVSCGFGLPSAGAPEIQLVVPDGRASEATVQVVNLSGTDLGSLRSAPPAADEWQALLRVTVAQPEGTPQTDSADQLPVAGRYAVTDEAIVFTPMFGFDPGRRYRVALDLARLPSFENAPAAADPGALVEIKEVSLPKADIAPATRIDRVYPTGDVVPENQLRLYIHFSAPMGLKGGLDYIKLLDDQGQEVKDPFLPLDTEFWNGDRTRFTVFFDPGRVKRGILPNKEMGRSLTEGKPYTLLVSRQWRDGQGLPLKEDFRRVFSVGPPDEKPLDQKTWRLESPRAGTREPFAVVFPEPLDHGLLLRALGVQTRSGGAVDGETRIDPGETRWTFTPREPWQAGDYQLRVLTILEDLAGNRIGRAFEVDQFERADRSAEPEEATIPFRISPQAS